MVFIQDPGARVVGSGRQRPGAIYVDGAGKRFCNESNSYVEVGKAMYAAKAVPCWQVFDEGYVGRYVSGANPLKKRTLSEGTDRAGCRQTCRHDRRTGAPDRCPARRARGNGQAVQRVRGKGLDPDFGRGQSAYNHCLGDPGYKPNAALGPLDRAPFYATRLCPPMWERAGE